MINAIGFAGFSNSGKTTLITRLAAWYEGRGIRVAVIKHDAHGHYKELPGTDSSKFIASGASSVVVVSPEETRIYERQSIGLQERLKRMEGQYDLVLIEGFKTDSHDKIAVFRSPEQAGVVSLLSPPAIAWAAEDPAHAGSAKVPIYSINDIEGIACFISNRFSLPVL
ncbi:molybdopterin-guanine dinucleotide biosynthesis protein B [Paenibacillus beijingensis]|uniref:molybdopterin-guanine dinucleotide biosynthesis protein B n=1 Tax=Paenibacillus beijingensis TaxID=1126833 RepID=UPI001EE76F47|nr:molybdopterin-guanine dinucleotide biosynthesis protein B [Paenibacillus beijingensis]